MPHLLGIEQRIVDGQYRSARDAEDDLDAGLLEGTHDRLRAGHVFDGGRCGVRGGPLVRAAAGRLSGSVGGDRHVAACRHRCLAHGMDLLTIVGPDRTACWWIAQVRRERLHRPGFRGAPDGAARCVLRASALVWAIKNPSSPVVGDQGVARRGCRAVVGRRTCDALAEYENLEHTSDHTDPGVTCQTDTADHPGSRYAAPTGDQAAISDPSRRVARHRRDVRDVTAPVKPWTAKRTAAVLDSHSTSPTMAR